MNMKLDMNKLYKKYVTLNIPNPFTLQQIGEKLRNQYLGEEIDLSNFSYLSKDPYAGFDTAVIAYTFYKKEALEKLLILDNLKQKMLFQNCAGPNDGCNLIINSQDGIYSSGFTTQGPDGTAGETNLLGIELGIFRGIKKEHMILGEERFDNYLKALYLAGYIQFENDPVIEQARQRYRNGYRLRWFDGSPETTF